MRRRPLVVTASTKYSGTLAQEGDPLRSYRARSDPESSSSDSYVRVNGEAPCLRPVNWGGNDSHRNNSFYVRPSQMMRYLQIVTLSCGSALTELPRRKVLYATRKHELQNRSRVLAATQKNQPLENGGSHSEN